MAQHLDEVRDGGHETAAFAINLTETMFAYHYDGDGCLLDGAAAQLDADVPVILFKDGSMAQPSDARDLAQESLGGNHAAQGYAHYQGVERSVDEGSYRGRYTWTGREINVEVGLQ